MTPYDEEVVRRRLRYLMETVDLLEADLPADPHTLADEPTGVTTAATERRLIGASQAVADVAVHISVTEGFGLPDDYRSAVLTLGNHSVLPQDLAGRLAHAVGLRNVLVHRYVDVDPARVVQAAEGADDFRRFISCVEEWMQRE
jgi:uncharacterized protein YutE (UPF0331/DUF86 family)